MPDVESIDIGENIDSSTDRISDDNAYLDTEQLLVIGHVREAYWKINRQQH